MDYISTSEAALKWGIGERRVRQLCREARIDGVLREGRCYRIPADTAMPYDARSRRYRDVPKAYTKLFADIDGLKREIDRKRPLSESELERLQEEFTIEYTYNSNAIEGNTLTLQETALVLEGVTIDRKPLKDHLEAVGHRDAFTYVRSLVRDKIPFSAYIIREIHSLVLSDRPADRGVFRRIPVRIVGAFHETCEPHLIQEKIDALLAAWRTSRRHPVEEAALFHILFEGIHPFVDGNGRTGRLIMNLFLMQNGYPPIDIKYANRAQYYDAFNSYWRNGDGGRTMVELVAGYVHRRLEDYLKILSQLP